MLQWSAPWVERSALVCLAFGACVRSSSSLTAPSRSGFRGNGAGGFILLPLFLSKFLATGDKMTNEELILYAVSNLGSIFSMALGALACSFMCWGFGRG